MIKMTEIDTDLINYIFEEIKKGKTKEEIYNFLVKDNSLDIKEEDFNKAHLVAKEKLELLKSLVKEKEQETKKPIIEEIKPLDKPEPEPITTNNPVTQETPQNLPYSSISYELNPQKQSAPQQAPSTIKPNTNFVPNQAVPKSVNSEEQNQPKYSPSLSTQNTNTLKPKPNKIIIFLIILFTLIMIFLIVYLMFPSLKINLPF